MNRTLYGVHRWISLLAALQLLVWSGTGLFFALVPIERIRGTDRVATPSMAAIPWRDVAPLPAAALAGAEEVTLRVVDGRPALVARAGGRRWAIDAATGTELRLDASAAERIARADQEGEPRAAAVLRVEAPPLEYRGGPVPAWRVELDDGRSTRVYVDAATGAVTARRNALWRTYDFLWGLHIMDYGRREDFNTPWLAALAALGVATALSGGAVWIARAARWRRRRGREERR